MANIMAMGIDNMNLFQQSEQKKSEAQFLVRSIARFNESLDLKKTLKSVTKKGIEFVGPDCRVLLFSETQVPLIKAQYVNRRGKYFIESRCYKKISSNEMGHIYELMKSQKKPVLIKSVQRSKRFGREVKLDFLKMNIHSLIGVPLKIREKILGLLLLIHGKDKRSFNSQDLSFAEALGNAASLSIENARAHTASLEMSEFLEKKISGKNQSDSTNSGTPENPGGKQERNYFSGQPPESICICQQSHGNPDRLLQRSVVSRRYQGRGCGRARGSQASARTVLKWF